MDAEIAAIDTATEVLEGAAAAGAFDEPNPDAVEAAAIAATRALLDEAALAGGLAGAREAAMSFVMQILGFAAEDFPDE
eukprot:101527-Lingulodinium_polyedra.AAC.1